MIFLFGAWTNPQAPKRDSLDFCQIHGSIYFAKKASEADYICFIESQEVSANLVIYKEIAPNHANQLGKWFIVDDPRLADYVIYLSPNISEADFTIAFTQTESFSGCNTNN